MADTVIDALVLEFNLDPAKFTKEQRQVLDQMRQFEQEAEKIGTRSENQARKTVDLMGTFRQMTLGVLAAFAGREAQQAFHNITSTDAAVGRLALTMNMSAREVSAWEGAAGQAGAKAGEMRSTLGGLTGDMNKFMLTGQGTLATVLRPLGVDMFDANKQLKDAGTLILDIVSALDAKGLDPARRAAFLQMLPGMTEGSLNLMMKSRKELEEYLKLSREIGGTTADSAQKAQEYERAISSLDRAFSNLGRTITTIAGPALAGMANIWTDTLTGGKTSIFKVTEGSLLSDLMKGKPAGQAFSDWYNKDKAKTAPSLPTPPEAPGPQAARSKSEVVAYIRQSAIARGIDPDVAVRVAESEGLNQYVGDKGSSFGPFQLHYGGVAPGMMQGGLGDVFTKKTGKNARDESTWREQIDFALDYARTSGRGWADWYGAGKAGVSQFAGIGKGGTTSSVTNNIGTVTINTQATNAKEIADDIKPQLERGSFTSQFNSGYE